MQSHRDDDSPSKSNFLAQLQARADRMKERGESIMAAGDAPLSQWMHSGVTVRKLPDDPQGILRISIGGGDTPVKLDYCSFRGTQDECRKLLRRALAALEVEVER